MKKFLFLLVLFFVLVVVTGCMRKVSNEDFYNGVLNGDLDVVEKYIKQGGVIDDGGIYNTSPLIYAASNGYKEMVDLFIKNNVDLNVVMNPGGYTALMGSILEGNDNIAKALISAGADVDIQSDNGFSALMYSVMENNIDITAFLVMHGADIDKQTLLGRTALMIASMEGYLEILGLLIQYGADINIKDLSGNTALSLARAKGYNHIVDMLNVANQISIQRAIK